MVYINHNNLWEEYIRDGKKGDTPRWSPSGGGLGERDVKKVTGQLGIFDSQAEANSFATANPDLVRVGTTATIAGTTKTWQGEEVGWVAHGFIGGRFAGDLGITPANSADVNTSNLIAAIRNDTYIIFDIGVYLFNDFIIPACSRVTLRGQGHQKTTFKFSTNSCVKFNSHTYADILISSIAFESSSSKIDVRSGGLIEKSLESAINNLEFRECKFTCPLNGQNGVRFTMFDSASDSVRDLKFIACIFKDVSRMGIEVWGSPGTLYTLSGVVVSGCYFNGIGLTQIPGPYSTSIACSIVCKLQSNVLIENCYFRNILPNIGGNSGGAIEVGRNTLVSRCVFSQDALDIYAPIGVYTSESPSAIVISECVEGKHSFYEFVYSDWKFYNCVDVILTNCVVRGNIVTRGAKLLRIIDNDINLQIRMENEPSKVIATGNKIGTTGNDYPVWAKVAGCVFSCANNSFYGDNATIIKDPGNCQLISTMNFQNGAVLA